MTQQIDPVKLKAAAEHLEWVCQQYPDVVQVQELYQGLRPMIEDAKSGRVLEPVERKKIPFGRSVSGERDFDEYQSPNIESAYVAFSTEMRGGHSDQEKRIMADMEIQREEILARGQS